MGHSLSFLYCLLYLSISILPLFITFFDDPPPAKSFGIEYTAAIGYIALTLMILQFATTERLKIIEKQFGFDLILQFHKTVGFVIFILILSHPVLLFFSDPSQLWILNPVKMPLRTIFAFFSLLSIFAIIFMSIFRKQWRLSYETWRVTHGFFAVLALSFGLLHAIKVDRYLTLFWKGLLWDVFVVYVIFHLIHTRVIRPLLSARKQWEVVEVREEKGRAWTVILQAIAHKGISFLPGQFAYLRMKRDFYWFNEHPFTISSSAKETTQISFTIKELGDFTNTVRTVEKGTKAYVDGPYGVFSYTKFPPSKTIWLIAGGIGITPMLSMLRTMKDEKDKREVHLFFAAKFEDNLTSFEEIEVLKQKLNLKTLYIVENSPKNHPDFRRGYITREILSEKLEEKAPECFICGPPEFIRSVRRSLRELKVSYKKIHAELFQLV